MLTYILQTVDSLDTDVVMQSSDNVATLESEVCAYDLGIPLYLRLTDQAVNAPDADVVMRSFDNVDFRLHKKNLERHSGGFPPADTRADPNEVVQLTESSETLEILFQFIYPNKPSLNGVRFELLMLLAEAAEKYEVYDLINHCDRTMRYTIFSYSLRLTN